MSNNVRIIENNIENNREQYGEVQNRIIGRETSIMSSGLVDDKTNYTNDKTDTDPAFT